MKRKSTPAKCKKQVPKLKNRYHRRSKLSEYKFLQVLRAYADDKPANEIADQTRLTERSVRALYDRFRESLMRAVIEDQLAFGAAGYFLFDDLEISLRGSAILDAVIESNMMRRAIDRHAPRVGLTVEPDARFSYLAFETAVRIFCSLSMKKDNDSLYSEEIQDAYAKLQLIAIYIHTHKNAPDDPELFAAVTTSFHKIMKDFPKLLDQEEFSNLISGHQPHRYKNDVLFEGLRRFIGHNPL